MPTRTRPTLKQERFAKAYVIEGNLTEAAIKAGYNVKNRQVAHKVGSENIQKPVVRRTIQDYRQFLESQVLPSLETIRDLRERSEDDRIRLAASRDLLNRAGVGKQAERPTNVVAVFSQMDETQLLERMARFAAGNSAKISDIPDDASHNIPCATQETADRVPGSDSAAAK